MNVSSNCWILFLSLICVVCSTEALRAQVKDQTPLKPEFSFKANTQPSGSTLNSGFPDPRAVMLRSMTIPGWGQLTNKQTWKVPIVYGLLGGLGYYSVYLTREYHDYRAAYYNSFESNTDLRFGETRADLENVSPNSLRDQRNFLRNRRDMTYVFIVLSYGLNIIDAYVFAHLRPFNVSDDLSFNSSVSPSVIQHPQTGATPGLTLTLSF
ncbi:MAG: DUF5683 domain-containing protein [Bacteroidota bacterium]